MYPTIAPFRPRSRNRVAYIACIWAVTVPATLGIWCSVGLWASAVGLGVTIGLAASPAIDKSLWRLELRSRALAHSWPIPPDVLAELSKLRREFAVNCLLFAGLAIAGVIGAVLTNSSLGRACWIVEACVAPVAAVVFGALALQLSRRLNQPTAMVPGP